MNDDAELLRRYFEEDANDAFAELVRRHVNLVYSVALRQLNGDAHLASDATQLVFTDLARKAGSLVGHRVLAGWLFTSTRFATAKLVRGERRRQAREQEAHLMQQLSHDDSAAQLDWRQVRPVLDDVIGELNDHDREAILLRFFEGRDYTSVGAKLNLADNTARMRVDRALEKLRGLLEQRGVKSTSAALAVALANQAVVAAPVGLAATVTGVALTSGVAIAGMAAGGATAAVGTFMSITKLQIGLAGALAVAGATGFVVQAESTAALQEEAAALRRENTAIVALQAENLQLARLAAEVTELRRDDAAFARLQEEASGLRTRLQQIARAEEARQRAAQVFDISKLDQTPLAKFQARPFYPAEMKNADVTGEVVVDFIVDANGDVQKAYAARSSRREFEAAAVEAVNKWKFAAGKKGGRDVATHMQVPIVFGIKGATPTGLAPQEGEKKPASGVVQLSQFYVETEPKQAK